MKAIYISGVICFLCFCTAQAKTPEREALLKEYSEIKFLFTSKGFDEGYALLQRFERKDLSKHPDILCRTHILKSQCYLTKDQSDSSHHHLDLAESLINNHDLDSLRSQMYRQRGLAYSIRFDHEKAMPEFFKGIKLAMTNKDLRQEMLLSYDIGHEYEYTSKLDSARQYITRAQSIASKMKDKRWIANCTSRLGSIEKRAGNHLKAMEYIFEGYKLAKIVKGDTENTRFRHVDMNLFHIYYDLGNFPACLEIMNSKIKIRKSSKQLFDIETPLFTKACILLRMDSLKSCEAVFDELEESYQISKNPSYYIECAVLRGGLKLKQEQWNAAGAELSILLLEDDKKFRYEPEEKMMIYGLSLLAKLKLRQGNYKDAISICEQQIRNTKASYDLKKQFYGTLASSHKALGNHYKAYEYLAKKDAIRDTIDRFYEGTLRLSKEQDMLDQRNLEEIEKLKDEKELNSKIALRQRNIFSIGAILVLLFSSLLFLWGRQRKLAFENALVDVKQQLLRLQINPHFIFNLLNSIQNSVLTLKKEKSIELISKFSKLMRQILQNSDKEKVSIHEELLLLTNYMDLEKIRTRDKFDYEVTIEEGIDIHNEEIPSMILQLFVENSIWHGIIPKEGQGHIQVKIEKENGGIEVVIDDNGIGRKLSTIHKSKDQQQKVSMGMKLIRQRIQTLNRKYRSNINMHISDGINGVGTQARLIA